ncbi:MAG: DUF4178 domain-containing protein [Filimonas sp.]|nr:DUF4178 domain-containing protein [Filimonas sp.]
MRATGLYACPDCGKTITYRNNETRLNVCTCGTIVNRLESDDLVKKYYYLIQEHTDLIQVGTTGKYDGRKFEVLGRFRMWFEDSAYNYWTIVFEDNSLAYLAEGYGLYAILRRTTFLPVKTAALLALKAGDSIQLKTQAPDYLLQRKDFCKRLDVQGEIWMPECNDQISLFELASITGFRAAIFEFLPGYLAGYDVAYTSFDDLHLAHINEEPLQGKDFNCPKCKEAIRVKTFPYAQSCGCVKCGTRFSLVNTTTFQTSGKDKNNKNDLDIPLGVTGKIKGIEYEVIGYALKKDPEGYLWKEYTLHNKREGYAFLSEFNGNWIYVREKGEAPVLSDLQTNDFTYGKEPFKLYNRYSISLVDVAGEFPYNIFDAVETKSAEFISPPEVWIYEKTKGNICWFLGEHITPKDVEKAYPFPLPYKNGTGMVEPTGYVNPNTLISITIVAVLIMIAVHLGINMTHDPKTIVNSSYQLTDTTTASSFVTEPFTLTKWRSNLEFEISADVDNSWFEMSASLVNAKTNEEFSLEQGVEYYHGYEDGETWSEGGRVERAYLSSIPAGTYFLRIEGSRDTNPMNKISSFFVTITNDVAMDRNLLIFIIPLLIWPAFKLFRMNQSERSRWSNSNFSPFTHNDD